MAKLKENSLKHFLAEDWSDVRLSELLECQYLELGDVTKIQTESPFLNQVVNDPNEVAQELVKLFLDPDYLQVFVTKIMNVRLFPYQMVVIKEFWTKRLPILVMSRGAGKTMLLAIYCIVRAVLDQGVKIVIAGAGLRQSGLVFEKMEEIWATAPILRDIVGPNNGPRRGILGYTWDIGRSTIVGIPIGTGDKIRGLRANVVVADEFSSINQDIFEIVLRGFAAVRTQDTFEVVQHEYVKDLLEGAGILEEYMAMQQGESQNLFLSGNQIILSGTAYYRFNHFWKYVEDYSNIILSKGRMSSTNYVEDYKEYSVITVPYDYLPPGLMDETILAQGKEIMSNILWMMEYGAVFPKDSAGFFPASTINGATSPLKWNDEEIRFTVELYGDPAAQYVMGIDPASERDNLAISIARLCDGYSAHVYSWSTNRKNFEKDKKSNKGQYEGINDYNTFIVWKIHDLISRFNIARIHLDAGGGGLSIVEGLKDPSKLKDRQSCIYDMEDPDVAGMKGLHIIQLCQFSNREWYEGAHYNLLKDMTARQYLFPEYDAIGIEKYRLLDDEPLGSLIYDTIESILGEVEETKHQTTLIEEQSTAKNQKKWDLPKIPGTISSELIAKLRKDHFTSLLLCCDAVRGFLNQDDSTYKTQGMSVHDTAKAAGDIQGLPMYHGRGLGKMRHSEANKGHVPYFDGKSTGGNVVF